MVGGYGVLCGVLVGFGWVVVGFWWGLGGVLVGFGWGLVRVCWVGFGWGFGGGLVVVGVHCCELLTFYFWLFTIMNVSLHYRTRDK